MPKFGETDVNNAEAKQLALDLVDPGARGCGLHTSMIKLSRERRRSRV